MYDFIQISQIVNDSLMQIRLNILSYEQPVIGSLESQANEKSRFLVVARVLDRVRTPIFYIANKI